MNSLSILVPLLTAWMLLCCWQDWRSRKIPNSWNLASLAVALGVQTMLPAGSGLFSVAAPGALGGAQALLAAGAMLLLGLLLWKLRLFGAGDAKMLTAIAAFVGPAGVLPVLLLTLCAGGVLALAALAWRKVAALPPHSTAGSPAKADLRLPYSLAIMAGTLGYIALVRTGLWGR